MKTRRHPSPCGAGTAFTLIELLVVMTIILLLTGLLLPLAKDSLHKARVTQTMSNGKGIYQVLFARRLDDHTVLPRSQGPQAYQTSTDYLRDLVREGILDVDWAYFSATGMDACEELEPEQFQGAHNAWCITADVNDRHSNLTPLLFTRSLGIRSLADDPVQALTEEAPFGTRAVVVVRLGGSASALSEDDLEVRFNPNRYENVVLRPGWDELHPND